MPGSLGVPWHALAELCHAPASAQFQCTDRPCVIRPFAAISAHAYPNSRPVRGQVSGERPVAFLGHCRTVESRGVLFIEQDDPAGIKAVRRILDKSLPGGRAIPFFEGWLAGRDRRNLLADKQRAV